MFVGGHTLVWLHGMRTRGVRLLSILWQCRNHTKYLFDVKDFQERSHIFLAFA